MISNDHVEALYLDTHSLPGLNYIQFKLKADVLYRENTLEQHVTIFIALDLVIYELPPTVTDINLHLPGSFHYNCNWS